MSRCVLVSQTWTTVMTSLLSTNSTTNPCVSQHVSHKPVMWTWYEAFCRHVHLACSLWQIQILMYLWYHFILDWNGQTVARDDDHSHNIPNISTKMWWRLSCTASLWRQHLRVYTCWGLVISVSAIWNNTLQWGRICSVIHNAFFWQDLWHIRQQRPSAPGVNLPEEWFLDTLKRDSRDWKLSDLWNQESSISWELTIFDGTVKNRCDATLWLGVSEEWSRLRYSKRKQRRRCY